MIITLNLLEGREMSRGPLEMSSPLKLGIYEKYSPSWMHWLPSTWGTFCKNFGRKKSAIIFRALFCCTFLGTRAMIARVKVCREEIGDAMQRAVQFVNIFFYRWVTLVLLFWKLNRVQKQDDCILRPCKEQRVKAFEL